jgi:hypothetical protein
MYRAQNSLLHCLSRPPDEVVDLRSVVVQKQQIKGFRFRNPTLPVVRVSLQVQWARLRCRRKLQTRSEEEIRKVRGLAEPTLFQQHPEELQVLAQRQQDNASSLEHSAKSVLDLPERTPPQIDKQSWTRLRRTNLRWQAVLAANQNLIQGLPILPCRRVDAAALRQADSLVWLAMHTLIPDMIHRPEGVFLPTSTTIPTCLGVEIKLTLRKARKHSGLEIIPKTSLNLLAKRLLRGGTVKSHMTKTVVNFAQKEPVAPTVVEALSQRMACIRLRRMLRPHLYRNSRSHLESQTRSTTAIDRTPTHTQACLRSLTSAAMFDHNQFLPTPCTAQ